MPLRGGCSNVSRVMAPACIDGRTSVGCHCRFPCRPPGKIPDRPMVSGRAQARCDKVCCVDLQIAGIVRLDDASHQVTRADYSPLDGIDVDERAAKPMLSGRQVRGVRRYVEGCRNRRRSRRIDRLAGTAVGAGTIFRARAARINLATRVSREMREVIQPKPRHIKPQNRRQ